MLVLVMAARLVAGLRTTVALLTTTVAVEEVRAVREVHGEKTNSQAEKKTTLAIAPVLAVRMAAAVGVRGLPTAAVMAAQEEYA